MTREPSTSSPATRRTPGSPGSPGSPGVETAHPRGRAIDRAGDSQTAPTRPHVVPPDRDASDLVVCTECGGVRGPWRYFPPDSRGATFVQRCRCEEREDDLWPRFDFNTSVELCWCCTAEAIPSGSRWSKVLCPECNANALTLMRKYGRFIVPIGRHSLMNHVGIGVAEAASSKEALAGFVRRVRGFGGTVTALYEWSRRQTLANLTAIGTADADSMPLRDYLAAVAELGVDKAAIFAAVCREFGVSEPRAADASRLTEGESLGEGATGHSDPTATGHSDAAATGHSGAGTSGLLDDVGEEPSAGLGDTREDRQAGAP